MNGDSDGVAFQSGIAGRLEDIPGTMRQTHDALLAQWRRRRASGVSWELFGGPLAPMFVHGYGRLRPGAPDEPAGTLAEGWERLARLLDAGEGPVPAGYLDDMKAWAAPYPDATLVVAFCAIRNT